MDQDTQQLDDNNPKSEATPEVASDTGQETPPAAATQAQADAKGNSPGYEPASPEPASSMSSDERKAALEAIIYAADEPATIEQLAKAVGEPKAAVQAALDELVASYASDTRGIEIRGVAGGYKMYTKPQHHDLVRRFIKSLRPPLRLTMPALETLAVISYKQPVTAPEIQEIRGVNTSGVIKTLLDKKLITTAGRKEVIGRPILYRTSKEFLMRFGLSDLGELPSLKEFEALAREALGTDEGVSESDAGDESVLDSIEPTEAEAVAELEASASEAVVEGGESLPIVDEAPATTGQSPAPDQLELISPDVAEAISAQASESAATPEPEPDSDGAIADAQEPAQALAESPETASESISAVAEVQRSSESLESPEPPSHAADAIGATSESQDPHAPTEQSAEPESVLAQSESAEPAFAEPERAQAVTTSAESSDSHLTSTEYDASLDNDSAPHEISDEILAQLTQGIEIEVSADSLAALSSNETPAEEAPAQFYSSDAEPEQQLMPTSQAAENVSEQSSEHGETEGESPSEKEKSRGAAAGE